MGRIAALGPEFVVKNLPLGRTLIMTINSLWEKVRYIITILKLQDRAVRNTLYNIRTVCYVPIFQLRA